jgi:hypothetical protein
MTRSNGLRAGILAGMATLAMTTFGAFGAAPAGAATTNPCKLLKKSEIQRAFGGTVSNGKKGLGTPVSAQCEFQVGANADRPDGTVIAKAMTTRGKAAYTGLKKLPDYVAIDGVANSLANEKLHVVEILEGDVLVGVQGGFAITDPLPLHLYDDMTQLTDLAQIAAKRV